MVTLSNAKNITAVVIINATINSAMLILLNFAEIFPFVNSLLSP